MICFVDAVNFLEQVKDEETAFRQLKHCNLAVITKTDLTDTGLMEQVAEKIREINPVCEIIESSQWGNGPFLFTERSEDLPVG